MDLTEREKIVGREFRSASGVELSLRNENDPPDFDAPHFIGQFRHLCPARKDKSTSIELKERYVPSPRSGDVAEGRFGFIYREGRCRSCGRTARSRAGRIVDGWQRPPLHTARS